MDPVRFDRHFLAPVFEKSKAIVAMLCDLDSPLVFCHDDIAMGTGPAFAPEWYEAYIFPRYCELWRLVHQRGKKVVFVADGKLDWALAALRRTGVGPFDEAGMYTLAQLEATAADGGHAALDRLLLPIESGLVHWPGVSLSSDAAFYLRQGQPVLVPQAPTEGWVRLYEGESRFLGMGEILDDGRVAPRRLMSRS